MLKKEEEEAAKVYQDYLATFEGEEKTEVINNPTAFIKAGSESTKSSEIYTTSGQIYENLNDRINTSK